MALPYGLPPPVSIWPEPALPTEVWLPDGPYTPQSKISLESEEPETDRYRPGTGHGAGRSGNRIFSPLPYEHQPAPPLRSGAMTAREYEAERKEIGAPRYEQGNNDTDAYTDPYTDPYIFGMSKAVALSALIVS